LACTWPLPSSPGFRDKNRHNRHFKKRFPIQLEKMK
jgi:hypothetical protein